MSKRKHEDEQAETKVKDAALEAAERAAKAAHAYIETRISDPEKHGYTMVDIAMFDSLIENESIKTAYLNVSGNMEDDGLFPCLVKLCQTEHIEKVFLMLEGHVRCFEFGPILLSLILLESNLILQLHFYCCSIFMRSTCRHQNGVNASMKLVTFHICLVQVKWFFLQDSPFADFACNFHTQSILPCRN